MHIAIVICAALFGSALNKYFEGFEQYTGSLVAVVIALTVVFAVRQIDFLVLVHKYPADPREKFQIPDMLVKALKVM